MGKKGYQGKADDDHKRIRIGIKALVIVLSLIGVVSFGGLIRGVVAWLSAKTEPVVNTFTYGDIDITLDETDTNDGDGNPNTNTYKMMPGKELTKDPKVTVLKESEDCWLFVKLEKSENFDDFMTYEMAAGWNALEGKTGVYYRQVTKNDKENQEFPVLLDNRVTVRETVTKEMLNTLDAVAGAETYPTLMVTAYAVQYDNMQEAIDSAADAWMLVEEKTQGAEVTDKSDM